MCEMQMKRKFCLYFFCGFFVMIVPSKERKKEGERDESAEKGENCI